MFLHLSVILFTGGSLCPGEGDLSVQERGVSVQEKGVSVQKRGVSLSRRGGSLSRTRGSLSGRGGSLCPGERVSLSRRGGLCLGEGCLCPGGVSVQGSMSKGEGESLSGTPLPRPSYGYVRAVCILLECILVIIST